MKSNLKLVFTLVMVTVLAGMAFACGGTPAETPTPTPTQTPTPTPTSTPTPTPTEQTYSYSANIFGETIDIPTDNRGKTLAAFEKTSPDGVITVKFDAGTTITGANLAPVKSFSATIDSNPTQPDDGSKIIGPTTVFLPYQATIYPPMIYQFNYGSFDAEIAEVANAEIKMGFLLSTGKWATYSGVSSEYGQGNFQLDATNKVATVKVGEFTVADYTIALLSQPPKVIITATEGPKNGVDLIIDPMPEFIPGGTVSLNIKTAPNARVIIWQVNPNTGTRSAYPADRIKNADAEGNVKFEWTLSSRTNSGEGHIELYATTSTDSDFLTVFNNYAMAGSASLDNYFPDKKANITNFKNGLIELLELDNYTTLRMYTITIK